MFDVSGPIDWMKLNKKWTYFKLVVTLFNLIKIKNAAALYTAKENILMN